MTKPQKQTSTERRMTAMVWYVFKIHNYLARAWAGDGRSEQPKHMVSYLLHIKLK